MCGLLVQTVISFFDFFADENRSVLDVHYKGCYRDGFVSDFETMVPMERQYLGVQSCTSKCHMKGYPFAALQDAKFCMCSQHQSRSYGMAQDESECMTRCPGGSENDRCGGPWTNAVYEIGEFSLVLSLIYRLYLVVK